VDVKQLNDHTIQCYTLVFHMSKGEFAVARSVPAGLKS